LPNIVNHECGLWGKSLESRENFPKNFRNRIMESRIQQIYEFDGFRLNVQERQLWRDGEPVTLYAKAFEMLVVMVENRGRLLTKDELFSLVWFDQIVEESNLTVNISAIRKALGERASQPRYVKTISGQGYRFVADVQELNRETEEFVVESETISSVIIEREESDTRQELQTSNYKSQNSQSAIRNPQFKITAACLILVLLGTGAYFWRRESSAKNFTLQIASIKRLTENGKVGVAALSPDGKLFAYSAWDGERVSLWLGYIDGGEPIEIRPPANVICQSLKFTPDGSSLYYVLSENYGRGALYRMPVFGGATEKVRDDVSWTITFAPDGKRFAFVRFDEKKNQSFLVAADVQGAGEQIIAASPNKFGFARYAPAWSPDGTTIAVGAATSEDGSSSEIFTVNVADGAMKPLTSQAWYEILGLVWQTDGSGLIVAARERSSSASSQLWQVSFSGGEAHRFVADLNLYGSSLSLPSGGSDLLAVQVQQQSNVWVAPADDLSAAKQITFASIGQENGWYGLQWMPDGRIIYTKLDEKGVSIWTMGADGNNQKQLIPSGGDNLYPAVTGDGRFVVFQSNRNGVPAIWRADIDGGNLVQLTHDEVAGQPALSPDGKWIVYDSEQTDSHDLRRISTKGGEPIRLSEKALSWNGISPDSKLIAADYEENGKQKLAIVSINSGELLKTFDVPRLANFRLGVHWTPDGASLTYRDWRNGIWKQELSGGAPQRLERLPAEKLYGYGWSRDGKQFAFVRGTSVNDVVLIRNAK
jgi:Tol biopolymer transport system component